MNLVFKAFPILMVLILISTGLKCQDIKWKGLGIGDSYLEISDSTLIFNGNDYPTNKYLIDSILRDTIYTSVKDQDTGRFKYNWNFTYSPDYDTISTIINGELFYCVNLSNRELLETHTINEVTCIVFNYNEKIIQQINLKSNGEISYFDSKNFKTSNANKLNSVKVIFTDISIIDLENIIESNKNFPLTHAPCYCFEIKFENENRIKYCRQKFNNYFDQILRDILVI